MMATKFGMRSPLEVIERVIKKVVLLLEKWPNHHEILEKNLGSSGLFLSLVSGTIDPLFLLTLQVGLQVNLWGSLR